MPQLLLFADPRPLVDRLGREFFQRLPETSGVYLMRDASGTVLYVGKAKNLRRRLNCYRVANPERLARRHLRLLRAVTAIELQACVDESAALEREAELILELKPRFNRAGTYRPPPRFLNWRAASGGLELVLAGEPQADFENHGLLQGGALYFHHALARLLWRGLQTELTLFSLPAGWIQGRMGMQAKIPRTAANTNALDEAAPRIQALLRGETEAFSEWVRRRLGPLANATEIALCEEDLETVCHFVQRSAARNFAFRSNGALVSGKGNLYD
jgi:hypothetical protein